MPELRNPRHETFAKLTAIGHSRADAYVGAGYQAGTPKARKENGIRMFMRQDIKARVTEIQEKLSSDVLARAEVDRQYVMDELKRNHEKCSAPEEVLDRGGSPTGMMRFNASGSNKSLELMGKELGMFADRLILDNLDEKLEGMSGNELRDFVRSAASEVGLRMVDQNDDEAREWIERNANRLGLRVARVGEGDDGAPAAEAGAVSAVPEAGRVPPTRIQ